MRSFIIKQIKFFVLFFFWGTNAAAHGGGGHAPETCAMSVGPFNAFFKGYQLEAYPKDTFCDSFPSLGTTALVMDLLQPDLRKSNIKVRVIEVKSIFESQPIDYKTTAHTLVEIPAQVYSTGLLSVKHEFEKPGHYAVLMAVEDPSGREYNGSIIFSVAMPIANLELYLFAAIILMIATGYLVVNVISKRAPKPKPATDP